MIVDTSAIIAILQGEPDADRFIDALVGADEPIVSAASYLEMAVVVDANRDPVLSRRLDDLLEAVGAQVEPVTQRHAEVARAAYRDYGKGGGHPAVLNFGDCFAYAAASVQREPLLYKGTDFTHTDVAAALA